MTEDQWRWQEPGTAWRSVGIYHITLTVPSRQPLLGTLVIPQNDPSQARVERTALGNAVVDELYVMCKHYPAIRILQFCLMPDHLHAVIQVTRVMDTSIRSVIRGYWQGVKKLGRAYTYYKPSDALFDACAAGRVLILSPWPYDANKRHISRADCVKLNNMAEEFCKAMESTMESGFAEGGSEPD